MSGSPVITQMAGGKSEGTKKAVSAMKRPKKPVAGAYGSLHQSDSSSNSTRCGRPSDTHHLEA